MNTESQIQHAVLEKATTGDVAARSMLYKQYSKAMFNICIRMTGNRADAEDVLQEAFINAFKNLSQVKNRAAFAGWLRKLVVNECLKVSKKQVRWNDISEDHFEFEDEYGEDQWFKNIELEQIHRAIKNLPDGCRQVFNLYVLEDFSHKEIAQSLNVSESTSKSQYQRARQLLKERLIKQLAQHG